MLIQEKYIYFTEKGTHKNVQTNQNTFIFNNMNYHIQDHYEIMNLLMPWRHKFKKYIHTLWGDYFSFYNLNSSKMDKNKLQQII